MDVQVVRRGRLGKVIRQPIGAVYGGREWSGDGLDIPFYRRRETRCDTVYKLPMPDQPMGAVTITQPETITQSLDLDCPANLSQSLHFPN